MQIISNLDETRSKLNTGNVGRISPTLIDRETGIDYNMNLRSMVPSNMIPNIDYQTRNNTEDAYG